MTTTKTKRRRRTKTAAKLICGPPPDTDLSHIVKALRPFAVHVASLAVDPRNPQLHDDRNIKAIADSMRRFGQDQPLIYRREDGMIIKGNGRYLAAKAKLGWEWIAAIPVDDPLVEAAGRGVADNQASRLADVDRTLMGMILQTIKDSDGELAGLVGYTDREVDALISSVATDQSGGEDDLPKRRRGRARTKRGDLWTLGEHRVLCGDSTQAEEVNYLMEGRLASLVFTDPPYGIDYTGAESEERLHGDQLTDDAFTNDLLIPIFKNMAAHARPDAAFYIWHAWNRHELQQRALEAAGLIERNMIIWAKPAGATRGDYQGAHEHCSYASRQERPPKFHGAGGQSTVWRVGYSTTRNAAVIVGTGILLLDGAGGRLFVAAREPRGRKLRRIHVEDNPIFMQADTAGATTLWEFSRDGTGEHPTQKPVDLCRRAIVNSSARGETVLDPFLGSGSTLIAAETVGRLCNGLEIDPAYCDLIVSRWEKQTGRKGERHRDRGEGS